MKSLVYSLLLLCIISSCREKKKEKKDTSEYFPILSYLQSQVKQLDTSLYRFTKVESEGNRSDTVIINRGDIRKYASDFLSIPDIKIQDIGSDYKASNIYDSAMGIVVMSYLGEDEDLEVTRQEVQIIPSFGGNDQVKTIYIDKTMEDDGTIIEKKMIWEVNRYFHIRTITQKKKAAEKIHDLRIFWEDYLAN